MQLSPPQWGYSALLSCPGGYLVVLIPPLFLFHPSPRGWVGSLLRRFLPSLGLLLLLLLRRLLLRLLLQLLLQRVHLHGQVV